MLHILYEMIILPDALVLHNIGGFLWAAARVENNKNSYISLVNETGNDSIDSYLPKNLEYCYKTRLH